MAISPWLVGQLAPVWAINVMKDPKLSTINTPTPGTPIPEDLLGVGPSNCSLVFYNTRTDQSFTGRGTFTVPGGNNIVQYQVASTDVADAGTYLLTLYIQFGTEPGPRPYYLGTWNLVTALPS